MGKKGTKFPFCVEKISFRVRKLREAGFFGPGALPSDAAAATSTKFTCLHMSYHHPFTQRQVQGVRACLVLVGVSFSSSWKPCWLGVDGRQGTGTCCDDSLRLARVRPPQLFSRPLQSYVTVLCLWHVSSTSCGVLALFVLQ